MKKISSSPYSELAPAVCLSSHYFMWLLGCYGSREGGKDNKIETFSYFLSVLGFPFSFLEPELEALFVPWCPFLGWLGDTGGGKHGKLTEGLVIC